MGYPLKKILASLPPGPRPPPIFIGVAEPLNSTEVTKYIRSQVTDKFMLRSKTIGSDPAPPPSSAHVSSTASLTDVDLLYSLGHRDVRIGHRLGERVQVADDQADHAVALRLHVPLVALLQSTQDSCK